MGVRIGSIQRARDEPELIETEDGAQIALLDLFLTPMQPSYAIEPQSYFATESWRTDLASTHCRQKLSKHLASLGYVFGCSNCEIVVLLCRHLSLVRRITSIQWIY